MSESERINPTPPPAQFRVPRAERVSRRSPREEKKKRSFDFFDPSDEEATRERGLKSAESEEAPHDEGSPRADSDADLEGTVGRIIDLKV